MGTGKTASLMEEERSSTMMAPYIRVVSGKDMLNAGVRFSFEKTGVTLKAK